MGAHAASGALTIASDSADNAAYSTYGAFDGVNGGSGFDAWSVSASSTGGSYVNASSYDKSGVLTSRVFDIFDNGTGTLNSGITTATRGFATPLLPGETFALTDVLYYATSPDNTGNPTSNLGFDLKDATGASVLTLDVSGGAAGYSLTDANRSGEVETNIPYNYQAAYTFAVTLDDLLGDYTLNVTGGTLPTAGITYAGMLNVSGGLPSAVAIFDNDGGYDGDVQFSNLSITAVPEPASLGLIGAAMISLSRRRRR